MPNISGIISKSSSIENPDEILHKYKKIHSLEGISFIHREYKSHDCVICNTLTGILKNTLDQPASCEQGNTFLFLEGEIFNVDELKVYLNTPGDISQCDLILSLFLKLGNDFVNLLNGEFNIVIYQKNEKQLTILNDHLASKPLYYIDHGRYLVFGSEKKSILAANDNPPSIDPLGLLQVFTLSHNINGRTFIRNIRRLPSSSILTHRNGRIKIDRYCALKFEKIGTAPKIEPLIAEWYDHLKKATRRRLLKKDRILINLSGGLDSRALALAIDPEFRPIYARTKGSPSSREAIIASEIARRLGFDHFIEPPRRVLFSDLIHKVVWRTECTLSFVGCLSIANHYQIKRYADFQIGGAYGNTTSGSAILPEMFLPCSREAFISKLYQRILSRASTFINDIFNKDFLTRFLPELRHSFFDSFNGFDSSSNIDNFEMWAAFEKQPQMALSSASVDSHLFEHIRPFLDKNYISFAMTLPRWLRFGPLLYHAMICRMGPEISDIPYANTNMVLRPTITGNIANKIFELGTKAYSKTFGKNSLPDKFKYQKSGQEGFAESIREDQAFQRIITEFTESPSFDSAVFNRKGILDILNKHNSEISDYTFPLCLVATFAVGVPYFITKTPDSCPPEAEPYLSNLHELE